MTLPLPLDSGTSVGGHYIINSLINTGGFGAVYRGIDTSEGDRPCAIKETYDVTPAARRQALMQAAILFNVRSIHLPQVYDAFEANGRFYLVMQLIEGQNLQQLLKARQHPCSEQEVLAWLLPIMNVLQGLHSRTPAIIHRDIKPSNIILTPDEMAVLVDFGLTKFYNPDAGDTQTMVRPVSEGYSPIEQYVGKTSPQSDIYSLAATIYFLLTRKSPPSALSRSYRDEQLVAPRILNPAISPKLEHALLKALALDAEHRYQSMQEFAQALQAPESLGVQARPLVERRKSASVQAPPAHLSTGATVAASQVSPGRTHDNLRSVTPGVRRQQEQVTTPAPGFVARPHPVTTHVQPLPSPFTQGCLWGILQGALAALLVLFLKKELYFYIAVIMGFFFYLLAGFSATRKGGKATRGGRAGFWAGITSTIFFWVVLALGLVVLLTQRVQADTLAAQKKHVVLQLDKEIIMALRVVGPAFPTPTAQPLIINLTIFLIGGLLLAIGLGLLGGLLGKWRHGRRATVVRM